MGLTRMTETQSQRVLACGLALDCIAVSAFAFWFYWPCGVGTMAFWICANTVLFFLARRGVGLWHAFGLGLLLALLGTASFGMACMALIALKAWGAGAQPLKAIHGAALTFAPFLIHLLLATAIIKSLAVLLAVLPRRRTLK